MAPSLQRFVTPHAVAAWSKAQRGAGRSIGFVPTMGALHAGHRSLVERARTECDAVVVSIFVNPAQFAPHEDLSRYPRPIDADLALLSDARVDAVFIPTVAAMYPDGARTAVTVAGTLTTVLEGAIRPGHFDGVCLVVSKLLNATQPDRVYFGQKDAQQCAVVARLIRDLDIPVHLVVCPVVRDPDGLALSSRNVYLVPEDRIRALALSRGLRGARAAFDAGERAADVLVTRVREELELVPGLRLDYVAAVDPETFDEVSRASVKTQIVVAAKLSGTRLIDVIAMSVEEDPSAGPKTSIEGEAPERAGV